MYNISEAFSSEVAQLFHDKKDNSRFHDFRTKKKNDRGDKVY